MLENYSRGSQIGHGQHGSVYHGFNRRTGREVAIKAIKRKNIRAEKMKMLRRSNQIPSSPHTRLTDRMTTTEQKIRKEIAIMKRCRHPHVVELLDAIDDHLNEKIYMVMEYMSGGELRWRDGNDTPILLVDQTRRICRDVTLGLEYLHYQGIIHRDIKPANLLWTPDRRAVKISDFGVSHFSTDQRAAAVGNRQAELDEPVDPILLDEADLLRRLGTPPFLAPEVVAEYIEEKPYVASSNPILSFFRNAIGSRPSSPVQSPSLRPRITKAVDIWALGVTMFCLLFGHTPFSTSDGEYVLYNIICNQDWMPEETMGFDRITTGGRLPRGKSEGAIVIKLLDKLLQKDVSRRITIDDLKRSSWFTRDVPDRDIWLRDTSPSKYNNAPIVSESETIIPHTPRVSCCNWHRFTRLSSILRPRTSLCSPLENSYIDCPERASESDKRPTRATIDLSTRSWQDKEQPRP